MALTGRSEWKFVTSDGKDLSAPAFEQAKLIKRGDLLVFYPQTQSVQVLRIKKRKQVVVSEICFPVIDNRETFRLLAENTRDLSRLDLVEVPIVSGPYWAYRFV